MRGVMEHRLVHADPNLANFAFRNDGRVVVYDFGCVKEVPDELARAYADAFAAVIDGRVGDLPAIFASIGLVTLDGRLIDVDLIAPYIELVAEVFRASPPYTFGEENDEIYRRVMRLGFEDWEADTHIRTTHDRQTVSIALLGRL